MTACSGEGNGNPHQYSCLENPRDRGAWWAAVYGVAQSQTRPKRLSTAAAHPLKTFIEVPERSYDHEASQILITTPIVYLFLRAVIGEGNGTPLQYSCLENPMDGGAW